MGPFCVYAEIVIMYCRRLYVKKCGELFEEKTVTDQSRMDQLASAKETMKVGYCQWSSTDFVYCKLYLVAFSGPFSGKKVIVNRTTCSFSMIDHVKLMVSASYKCCLS